ncbi:thiazole tautomerase TenI [Virgibacillus halodenitrificans]|uniref:thiazole tautomerase TenI n=1 Tax=Virgibacillus halodenitrificans TaxID=1482 RepID=UPI001F3438A4|nr:thiazole tautomerase TenI [Virgibacillus halodenitrificans]
MQRKSMELIYSTISVLLFIFKNHKKEAINIKELHVISTGQQTSETLVSIVAEIHRYIDFLHLREPEWTDQDLVQTIENLSASGVPMEKLIVNHRVDVANQTGVHGVQLTYRSMEVAKVKNAFPELKVGCSVHTVSEATQLAEQGADYLVYGHIFETASKPDLEPKGVGSLQHVARQVSIPVIAIGGIRPKNVPNVLGQGASGVAVLSGILLAKDPLKAAQEYRYALTKSEVVV